MPIIAIATVLVPQAAITLMFQPKVGSTYKQVSSMQQTSQMGNSGMTMTTSTKVLSFEKGFYKLENTPSNVKMTGAMAGAAKGNAAVQKPSIMYMDQHFKPKLAGNGTPGMAQLMGGMNDAYAGITFPSKPIKVGETWTNSIDMGQAMGAAAKAAPGMKSTGKMNMTYKLLKVEGNSVLIGLNISGTVNMSMAGGKGQPGGASGFSMAMTFSGNGTSSIEKSTGIPISSNTKMSIKSNFGGKDMTFTQTMSSKRA
jgi:hypothetical protein